MAKLSLLDMVQNILSALDSDPVNSIDDTVESAQVADIVKESFFDLMSQRDWPHLHTLSSLVGLGDTNNPTRMMIPETLNKIKWLKYNRVEITYMEPKEFQDMIDNRTPLTGVVNGAGYITNSDPTYWTSFDDKYIVFDGYDSTADDTLQQSKSIVYGVIVPTWSHVDNFIPNLPEKFFPTLLAEAKAQAFVNLKQQANAREERKSQRGRTIMQNESWRNEYGELLYNRKINYGR